MRESVQSMKIPLIGDLKKNFEKFSPKNAKVRFFLAHPVNYLICKKSYENYKNVLISNGTCIELYNPFQPQL